MGWSSGSSLFSEVISTLLDLVPSKETRKNIYRNLIKAFEYRDWDTEDECIGLDIAYDEVYKELFPSDETFDEEND